MANLRKAYMLSLNSIGRNLSADILFNDPNGTATKIRSLMDKWDLLQTSNRELYDTSQKSSFNKNNFTLDLFRGEIYNFFNGKVEFQGPDPKRSLVVQTGK